MRSTMRVLAIAALGAAIAGCNREKDLEELNEEVLEAHEDVVEQAEATPFDTAAIAREAAERDSLQEEAARKLQEETRQLPDTTRPR